MAKYDSDDLKRLSGAARALADAHRLRALLALRAGELCVCQLTELLALAPSTVSKHLSILEQAGLAERRKTGRWAFYRRPRRPVPAARRALHWLDESVSDDPQIASDARRLKAILKIDPEILCSRQRKS